MEQDILNKLSEQEARLSEIQKTVRQLHTYFKWTLIITVLVVVLPAIGMVFAIPLYLKALSGLTGGLGL